MTKENLAHAICYCVEKSRNTPMSVGLYCPAGDIETFLVHATGSAGIRLIQGKVLPAGKYLVSRGVELPHLKPSAIVEYSGHWPYDYCYLYNINER